MESNTLLNLNSIAPAPGSKTEKRRVGRGVGSGFGKTAGRGHKGLKSRSGGTVKPGFEGGQTPLQRRLPKFGFTSRVSAVTSQVTLSEVAKVGGDVVNLEALKAAGLVTKDIKFVKVIKSGSIDRAVHLQGIKATKGALEAIEAAGGKVEG